MCLSVGQPLCCCLIYCSILNKSRLTEKIFESCSYKVTQLMPQHIYI